MSLIKLPCTVADSRGLVTPEISKVPRLEPIAVGHYGFCGSFGRQNALNTLHSEHLMRKILPVGIFYHHTAQCALTPNFSPVALSTALSVLMVGLPRADSVR